MSGFDCGVEKQDNRILAVTSRDIVAAEAHYHNSCYGNYTRKAVKPQEFRRTSRNESENTFDKAESEAYADLFMFITNEMLPNKLNCSCSYTCNYNEELHAYQRLYNKRIHQDAHQTETGIRS